MVTPNAKATALGDVDEWRRRLVVKVRAVPSEGRANRAVCDLFQELTGAKTTILHGATDRHKTIFIPLPGKTILEMLERAHARR